MTAPPCPFCGSTDTKTFNFFEDLHRVSCNNCGASGPTDPTPEQAITLFSGPASSEQVRAVKEAYGVYIRTEWDEGDAMFFQRKQAFEQALGRLGGEGG